MPLNVNDILTTVIPFINSDIDGIETSYAECVTPQEQINFIKNCRYLIGSGWTEEFNAGGNEFFTQVLGPVLVNPVEKIFANKTNITPASNTSIIFFGRYVLFNSLLNMYKNTKITIQDNEYEDLKNWFLATKELLDQEFNQLSKKVEFSFNKFSFKSIEELTTRMQASVPNKDLSVTASLSEKAVMFFGLALLASFMPHYRSYKENKDQPSFVPTGIFLLGLVLAILIQRHQQNKFVAGARQRLFHREQLDLERHNAFMGGDSNIQKFVFVNKEDIIKTFTKANPNSALKLGSSRI